MSAYLFAGRHLVLLGIKEYKHCYLTADHNAYVVTQQGYVISLNSRFKKTHHRYSVQSCKLDMYRYPVCVLPLTKWNLMA